MNDTTDDHGGWPPGSIGAARYDLYKAAARLIDSTGIPAWLLTFVGWLAGKLTRSRMP